MSVRAFGRYVAIVIGALVASFALGSSVASAQEGGTSEVKYIEVRDGTEIAVRVAYPPTFDENDVDEWPAVFTMEGYGGAQTNVGSRNDYVVVYASIRGTGCSAGEFDLFSWESALDGRDIIDDWIAEQPWSNGRVAITGHSYSGITGFMVAQTQPEHLEALAVSGLIGDFYRDLIYMGGITNLGFPVFWGALARAALEAAGNIEPQLFDDECRERFLRDGIPSYVPPLELVGGIYLEPEERAGSWHFENSLRHRADRINVPAQLGQQYQDEQTGPRGGFTLWDALDEELPKRLILTNGRHGPSDPQGTKWDWMDCWVLNEGQGCGDTLDPDRRVLAHFESRRTDAPGATFNTPYATADFPAPETEWQRHDLAPRDYVSLPTDHRTALNTGLVLPEDVGIGELTFQEGLPTEATWTIEFDEDTAVFGPMAMELYATATAPDVDFFVDVMSKDPETGELRYLQRGMLRGGFRTLIEDETKRVEDGPYAGEIYRPFHDHTHQRGVNVGAVERYNIEIYPLGHVFREGEEMLLRVHAPPINDPLSIGIFASARLPALVQTQQSEVHPSGVMIPTLPELPPLWNERTPCGQIAGELCIKSPE